MRHAITKPPRKRKVRFPGVADQARRLGVNIRTLQRVLGGEWQSQTLLARWKQLTGATLTNRELMLIANFNRQKQRQTDAALKASAPTPTATPLCGGQNV